MKPLHFTSLIILVDPLQYLAALAVPIGTHNRHLKPKTGPGADPIWHGTLPQAIDTGVHHGLWKGPDCVDPKEMEKIKAKARVDHPDHPEKAEDLFYEYPLGPRIRKDDPEHPDDHKTWSGPWCWMHKKPSWELIPDANGTNAYDKLLDEEFDKIYDGSTWKRDTTISEDKPPEDWPINHNDEKFWPNGHWHFNGDEEKRWNWIQWPGRNANVGINKRHESPVGLEVDNTETKVTSGNNQPAEISAAQVEEIRRGTGGHGPVDIRFHHAMGGIDNVHKDANNDDGQSQSTEGAKTDDKQKRWNHNYGKLQGEEESLSAEDLPMKNRHYQPMKNRYFKWFPNERGPKVRRGEAQLPPPAEGGKAEDKQKREAHQRGEFPSYTVYPTYDNKDKWGKGNKWERDSSDLDMDAAWRASAHWLNKDGGTYKVRRGEAQLPPPAEGDKNDDMPNDGRPWLPAHPETDATSLKRPEDDEADDADEHHHRRPLFHLGPPSEAEAGTDRVKREEAASQAYPEDPAPGFFDLYPPPVAHAYDYSSRKWPQNWN